VRVGKMWCRVKECGRCSPGYGGRGSLAGCADGCACRVGWIGAHVRAADRVAIGCFVCEVVCGRSVREGVMCGAGL